MKNALFLLLFFIVWTSQIIAQSTDFNSDSSDPLPSCTIFRTDVPITVDGKLEEAVWDTSYSIQHFWQFFPSDTSQAVGQTELYMTYDEEYLYIATKCYTTGSDYVTASLKRDYRLTAGDNISVMFDTYNDQTNAILFGMNAFGVQREALIANGGRMRSDFSGSWDNRWFGEASIGENYWTAEMAIPFKTLRFKEGGVKWRFNCYRNDTQLNEWSSWVKIPRNRLIMDLSFMGDMAWDEPLPKPGTNISVIPYVTAGVAKDFEEQPLDPAQGTFNIGGDAKIALTSALNLDLTANPDFSQVEVDQQVTNLNRFEIFFPERRQFFLENADLFNSFGLSRVNPFFSRRIGIAVDTTTGQNIQNPIIYGARLSGKLNDRLRVGLMNLQTAKQEDNGLPGFNFTVATLQQTVFKRSNISFIFVNKQAINGEENNGNYNLYNRIGGLEYRLASNDNRWSGKTFLHFADTPLDEAHKFTHGLQLEYIRKKYRFEWAHLMIGNGYRAEVGFVPRKDYVLMSPEAGIFFYPKRGLINQHSINLDTRFFLQIGKDTVDVVPGIVPNYGLVERNTQLDWDFQMKNNTRGLIQILETDLTLIRNFDPTRLQADSIFLAAGTKHHFISLNGEYQSDLRKKFVWSVQPNIGQFFNGFRTGMGTELTWRYQPYGSFSLAVNYNYIKLKAPFEPVNIWLVGPKIDFTFSKSVFFTTFFQYNSQLDNLNINARFQWRFAPVSDFFIVYTDNYLVDSFSQFGERNRTLVAKLTYWLNL